MSLTLTPAVIFGMGRTGRLFAHEWAGITPDIMMVATAARSLSERNAHDAGKLAESDEEMDELRKSQFRILLGTEWPYSVEAAVDVALSRG